MEEPCAREGSVSLGGNCPRALSRGQRRQERERNRMQDGHETRFDLDEWSLQGERSVSNVPEHLYCSELDREIENLRNQVKKLEIEIRGWRRRRDRKGLSSDPNYEGGSMSGSSHRTDSQCSRERSNETMGQHSNKNRHSHPSAALDAMRRALRSTLKSCSISILRWDRAYRDAKAFQLPTFYLLRRQNWLGGTCEPLYSDDVLVFPK